MKRVLLISFFNSTNVGDKAICDILNKKIQAFSDVTVMDISGRPVLMNETKTLNMADNLLVPKCRFYTLKSIAALRRPDRLDYAKALIRENDVVLFAGGNMIMEHERFSYYSYLCDNYVRYAKSKGKRVIFAFVGVGENRTMTQKKRWKHAIMRADMVSVRDSLSRKKLIEDMQCHRDIAVWKDPAFLFENIKEEQRTKTIGINIYVGSVKDQNGKDRLIETYLYFIEELRKSYNIVLYSTEAKDEQDLYQIYERVQNKEGVEVCCPRKVQDLTEIYKTVDFAITTRMHAFILALSQETPSISLAWDRKINGVVNDIGLSDLVYDIRKVYDEKEMIVQAVKTKMEKYQECLAVIKGKSSRAKKDCIANFEQLKVLIEE